MVDDDTFTYHVKQQSLDQTHMAAHSLITKERKQKLDLFIHLLANLNQSLIICGPEGIGKTTLLKVLLERKAESWRYCVVQDPVDLSFEAVQEQIADSINLEQPVQLLSMALAQYESQNKQVILIVDNAAELVPGLISAIIQYAAANPVLRVVFALTPDELRAKRESDRSIDDCHIVELPPLSEQQCGDFLQHLSTNPAANLMFKEISDNMIANIHRKTQGIPGRIIAELSGDKPSGKLQWILALAAVGVCALVLGNHWLSKNNDKPVNAPAIAEQTINPSAPPSPLLQSTETINAGSPAQPSTQPLEQSAKAPAPLTPVSTEEKAGLEPAIDANTHKDAQQQIAPAAKPELANTVATKQPPEIKPPDTGHNVADLLGASREKPKPSELTKTVDDVGARVHDKLEAKAQPEQSSAGLDQKTDNKQAAGAPQKTAEPIGSAPEKPKENSEMKTKSEPSGAVEPHGSGYKQSDAIQQKIAGPIGAKQEKSKKFEPKKKTDSGSSKNTSSTPSDTKVGSE